MPDITPTIVSVGGNVFTILVDGRVVRQSGTNRLYNGALPAGYVSEVSGTRSETLVQFDFTATVSYHCRWDDRYWIARWLANSVYNNPSEDAVNLGLTYYNSYYPARAINVTMKPLGAEGKTINVPFGSPVPWQPYTMAQLDVQYKGRALPSNVSIRETVTPASAMRQLPSWGFYWRSDNAPVLDAEAPAIQERSMKIQRNLSGVRRIPYWFLGLEGCINANDWTDALTGMNYLAGTLLYTPTSMDRTITMSMDDDDFIWNVAYELAWNPIGWNNFRRPHGVDTIMYKESEYPLFPRVVYPSLGHNVEDPTLSLLGADYFVQLQRYDGSTYIIHVDWQGNVVVVS